MSAIPPKADMVQHDRDARYVPEADIQPLNHYPQIRKIKDF
jgi:hypothetical protein